MKFKVTAMDPTGMEVTEEIEAPTKDDAQAEMRRNGLFVTSITPIPHIDPTPYLAADNRKKRDEFFSQFFSNRFNCVLIAIIVMVPVWGLITSIFETSTLSSSIVSFILGALAALLGDFCYRKMYGKD